MAALVTLPNAKVHLRITDSDHDADVQLKVNHASDVIVRYLASDADPAWTDVTVPNDVVAAILILLTHLYEDRGAADDMKSDADKQVWDCIARLLQQRRTPALA